MTTTTNCDGVDDILYVLQRCREYNSSGIMTANGISIATRLEISAVKRCLDELVAKGLVVHVEPGGYSCVPCWVCPRQVAEAVVDILAAGWLGSIPGLGREIVVDDFQAAITQAISSSGTKVGCTPPGYRGLSEAKSALAQMIAKKKVSDGTK